ncbi:MULTISPECIES: hypothetical protein [Halococcus]|uniref:Uncharacterized protein n=1 Tax=Halococcus salifodinae DSM 8989 TaxID=1227456 RepID=M0N5N3_9EURY|nr:MULTISPECIES: hypothetical protein [Halococcus]EMA53232.1 hypothetical protein C450_07957 [Halococcus salifodinae DSM 8989]
MERFDVTWRTLLSVIATIISIVALLWAIPHVETIVAPRHMVVVVAGYTLLLATSGYVVMSMLSLAGASVDEAEADTGSVIGKVENVLILTLTLLGAYTALGLVFTAKSIVRWQDISSGNTTYYLTGSVANVTYSLVFGIVLRRVLDTVA